MDLGLVDLHRHLDGSMRAQTLRELAAERGLRVPEGLRFRPGMSLEEALSKFAFTLSTLDEPAAVRRVAREMCEDAAAEGVSTLEIRFGPQLHRPRAGGEAPIEAVVDAALEGIDGRAGLILCGLYGEPPELLHRLVEVARTRLGVVGLDLAGGTAPDHRYRLEDYASAFQEAAELGLGRTVHAGEGRRPPSEIRAAIEILGAQRIGHGTCLLEDPSVLELVLDRGITIEACPTSNWQTRTIERFEDHPLKAWLARGVKVCVCADNTYLSETDAAEEMRRVMERLGIDEGERARLIEAGHAAAFRRA